MDAFYVCYNLVVDVAAFVVACVVAVVAIIADFYNTAFVVKYDTYMLFCNQCFIEVMLL